MSSIVLSGNTVRRQKPARSGFNVTKFFYVAIAVLLVVLGFELIFHLVIAPRLMIRNINIISDSQLGLDDRAILTIAELDGSVYYFDIEAAGIAERLEQYPLIREARVEKVFPDTLKIQVLGREPLAIALASVAPKSGTGSVVTPVATPVATPVVFDEDGVVFQIGASVESFDLPVISGLTFNEVRLGQRIARPLTEFLQDLYKLRRTTPELFNLISEVKFVKKNRSSFEVVLFPRDYPVRVLLGTTIDADLMKRIVLVLDVFSRNGSDDLREIDFRTEEIVMRVEGE